MSVRAVVADDQELVRAGLVAILEADGVDVVGEAADGNEAVALVARTRPDVALLDVRMPGLDGLSAARQILAAPAPPRVLMLTTFDLDEYVYDALRMGASGFLLKDTPREQLVAAVRTVAAGDALLDPGVARRLVERLLSTPDEAGRTYRTDRLSPREADVLRLLAQGLSNSEIGRRLFVSEATVKTHVAHLLAKLEVRDRVQAVVAAFRSGLVS